MVGLMSKMASTCPTKAEGPVGFLKQANGALGTVKSGSNPVWGVFAE
jgi:hypothetical protein